MPPPAPNQPVVAARNVNKVFKDFWGRPAVHAVQNLNLTVQAGEVFGLLGPNGSGKSTTLKMLLGLLYPTRGELEVLGRPPTDVAVKARLGYMPEESHLYNYLTAEEALDFYARLAGVPAGQRAQRIDALLTMLALQPARRRRIGEYSKGMARRVGLAQALINDPDLILLDEPTSGLDPLACRQVKDLILILARRGKTVLISSHHLADMQDVCDRVAILHNGRLCAEGPVRDLLRKPEAWRLTLPAIPEATLRDIVAGLTRTLGTPPTVDHPMQSLEQFFVDIVADRHPATQPIAGFLATPPPAASP